MALTKGERKLTAVLFAPHNDDETLFAFYTMLRYKAEVVVVLRSMRQEAHQNGPIHLEREKETLCATGVAGVSYVQWTAFFDVLPQWPDVARFMQEYVDLTRPETVIAPAYEINGHEDHNAVAQIAQLLRGEHDLIQYLTYRRGYGRSEGQEVVPTEEEARLKARALACYRSQHNFPPTAAWFGDDQREFLL